jgi:protein phosphatase methylesterase 1
MSYLALIVIDVVEGVALEALPYMEGIVHSRPKSFKTLEAAIKWK